VPFSNLTILVPSSKSGALFDHLTRACSCLFHVESFPNISQDFGHIVHLFMTLLARQERQMNLNTVPRLLCGARQIGVLSKKYKGKMRPRADCHRGRDVVGPSFWTIKVPAVLISASSHINPTQQSLLLLPSFPDPAARQSVPQHLPRQRQSAACIRSTSVRRSLEEQNGQRQ
jgi:hypothetical protein